MDLTRGRQIVNTDDDVYRGHTKVRMPKKNDDNGRDLFEQIKLREAELADMRRQASQHLLSQLDRLLAQMDQYGVELPQSLVNRMTGMLPVGAPRPDGLAKKPARRTAHRVSKSARPEGIPEEARFCKVCGGWTDHDTRSHRQEKPAIQRKLKYGQPEQSQQPRLVRTGEANA